MRDNRSYIIKKILKQKYPDSTFRVRIEKYSGGESIEVYTDLIKFPDYNRLTHLEFKLAKEGLTGDDLIEYHNIKELNENNNKIEQEIKQLLKEFYHVNRDMFGEILLGVGNTYLFINPMERLP